MISWLKTNASRPTINYTYIVYIPLVIFLVWNAVSSNPWTLGAVTGCAATIIMVHMKATLEASALKTHSIDQENSNPSDAR